MAKGDGGGKNKGNGNAGKGSSNKIPKGRLGKDTLGKTPKGLQASSRKQIARQARKTVRAAYKPAQYELNQQEKSLKQTDKKRAADNFLYLQWLDTQQRQLAAHSRAAESQIEAEQIQMQQSAAQAMQAIRGDLVDAAPDHTGTTTNANQAQAFDISAEAQRGLEQIGNERMRTQDTIGSIERSANTESSSNFAMQQASEANRQADFHNDMADIHSEKVKVRLDRAAAQAAEVARLLDQEIQKGELRFQFRQAAAQTALQQQAQRLDNRKFRFDKRAQLKDLNETERHNQAVEKETAAHNDATEAAALKQISEDHWEAKLDAATAKNASAQEKKKAQQEITASIQDGVSYIQAKGNLKSVAHKNPKQAIRELIKADVAPLLAQTAVAIINGGINKALANKLKSAGYNVPSKWVD